jgi:hypothetical protein
MEFADSRPDPVEGFGHIKGCSVVSNGDGPVRHLPGGATSNLPRI